MYLALHYHNNINNNSDTILEEENLSNSGEFTADSEDDDETLKTAYEDCMNNNFRRQYSEVNESLLTNSEGNTEESFSFLRNQHQKFKEDPVVEAEAAAMAVVLASKSGRITDNSEILQNKTEVKGPTFSIPAVSTTTTKDQSCSTNEGFSISESLERRKRRPIRQITTSETDFTTNPEGYFQRTFDSLGSRGRSLSRRTADYSADEESQTTQSLQRHRTHQSFLARNEVRQILKLKTNYKFSLPI